MPSGASSCSVAQHGLLVERCDPTVDRGRGAPCPDGARPPEPPVVPLGVDGNPGELGSSVPGALEGRSGAVTRWSGVALLPPGWKVRLVAGAGYRLSVGRTCDAKPGAAVPAGGDGEELIEVSLEHGRGRLQFWRSFPQQQLRASGAAARGCPSLWPGF
eukprot:CAMPEP_0175603006 /NCGR_PEP_ID=MMETSP0096-20121207/58931_1 /TAXON_ID=311494 /ORGANISM="Alexandrium monilatum, Strain CCMP3105" /LENGTH=158 /DNA_ID=CAMNT_0016907699 /DNA_START=189 /DNA_END=662 /DNA_ORIENTATION=-